jgi:uncharacterized protein YcbK (DUF882 family)
MKLTKNFSLSEFDSKDGTDFPLEYIPNVQKLAKNLQILRDHLNAPITINSGWRSESHNKKIKGKPKSTHLKALGADIVVDGYTPQEVFDVIEFLQEEGVMEVGGLHAYGTFIHYDIRGFKARW